MQTVLVAALLSRPWLRSLGLLVDAAIARHLLSRWLQDFNLGEVVVFVERLDWVRRHSLYHSVGPSFVFGWRVLDEIFLQCRNRLLLLCSGLLRLLLLSADVVSLTWRRHHTHVLDGDVVHSDVLVDHCLLLIVWRLVAPQLSLLGCRFV